MLLPDDGIGVAVLTNTSASLMSAVVACRVLDELLGAEPLVEPLRFDRRPDTQGPEALDAS